MDWEKAPFELKVSQAPRENSPRAEDARFAILIDRWDQENPSSALAAELHELKRSPEKLKIITDALVAADKDWMDLLDLKQNPEVAQAFSHLVTFGGFNETVAPKDIEKFKQEAESFAKKLE